MTQGDIDPLFDSADFSAVPPGDLDAFGSPTANLSTDVLPSTSKAVAVNQQKHGFTVYTLLLYLSLLMTATAGFLLYKALELY